MVKAGQFSAGIFETPVRYSKTCINPLLRGNSDLFYSKLINNTYSLSHTKTPSSARAHQLIGTLSKWLRRKLLRQPEVKLPRNDSLRMSVNTRSRSVKRPPSYPGSSFLLISSREPSDPGKIRFEDRK